MEKVPHTPSPVPSTRSSNGHDDDELSVSSQHIRKRDRIRNFFRTSGLETKPSHAQTASSQGSAEAEHVVSSTAVKRPDMTPQSLTLPIKSRFGVFFKNVPSPVVNVPLPEFRARIESTPQLALCIGLIPKDLNSFDQPEAILQDNSTDTATLNWVRAVMQDPIEQDHIRWLGTRMVEEFIKDPSKDSIEISEIVLLGPVLQREHYRLLLLCITKEFDESPILNINMLQGLVQLAQSASEGFLVADDLIKILDILRRHLEDTHQQSTEHPFHLTLAVSQILDVMADHKVQDLDRVAQHEPLSAVLSILKTNPDPYLLFQASYAFQALQYVPDNETALQAVLRHSGGAADSLIKISGVLKLDLSSTLEGLRGLQAAVSSTYEIAGSVYDGVRSLMESGRGVLDSLKEGFGSGHKQPWYPALRVAHAFVYTGQLADLNELICEAPCRRDPLFQWGICQLLGEIATDSIWDIATRQHAIDLLGALFKDDDEWGQDESVKAWMLNIFGQLGRVPEYAVKVSALLQSLRQDQVVIPMLPYPLRNRLPMPASSPTLAKVQNIPYVEYDLHQYQVQRLKQSHQTVYIPPMAKPNLKAKDDDLFLLLEKVQEFLISERQVMLILGDSGSGKSTFNRHLEHRLWTAYKQGGPIPLYINLPTIDRPDQDLIAKQLKLNNFKDDQIQEMKQYRQLVIICDGYDESQLLVNLHKTNLLNQPGQWKTKMVISCRTQFLGPTYLDRFKPQPDDRYTSGPQDLFQEAVIAPFSKDQINSYIDQFARDPQTQPLFGNRAVWSSSEYMDKLMAIPNVMDLVKNPFLLTLSLKALPAVVESNNDLSSIRVTRVGLYDLFVDQWLETNKRRLQTSALSKEGLEALNSLIDDDFILCVIDYLKRLAVSIFKEQNGAPIVQYSQRQDKDSWKTAFFGTEPEAKLFRESSPLIRTGHQYRFVHRSVLEYLFSRAIYDPVNIDAESCSPAMSISFSIQLTDADSPFFQRSLLAEPSVIQFLCDRVQQRPDFEQQLRSVIEQSKTDASAATAAANAITILVRAKVRFNASDLRGIRIPGADLSGGQFDSAQFQRADLTGANLTRSWIRQADFSNARMEGTHFGELPYVKEHYPVYTCTYSPDGKTFAVAASKDINIYDTTSWTIIHQLRGHKKAIYSVTFSPCGKRLLSGSNDNTARLWDCQPGESLFVLEGHTSWVYTVAYSPSGKQVASADYNGSVRVWDPETGALVFAVADHTMQVRALAFSPDGLWLASGSQDRTFRFYDAQTGTPGHVLNTSHGGIGSIAFSPIDQRIAVGHRDGHMQLCDTTTGKTLLEWSGHSVYILGVTFSTDGQWIATASHDQTARLWDAQTGSLVSIFAGHTSTIYSVAFSPDGSQLATGGYDKTMRFLELNLTGPSADSQDKSDPVLSVAYSHDGQWVVSGRKNGVVQQYNAVTGESGFVYPIHLDGYNFVAFSPTSHQFASVSTTTADEVKVWNADTGAFDHVLRGHTNDIFCLSFSPCGGRIVSGSDDNTIRLWDARSGTLDKVLEGHSRGITALVFSPDGRRLVSCDWGNIIGVWEVATGEFRILPHPPTHLSIKAIAYSPNGQQVTSWHGGDNMYIIDVQTGNVLHTLDQEPTVECLQFSPCGEWLAMGGDGAMILWRSASDGEGGGQKWSQVVKIEGFLGRVDSIDWRPQNSSDRLELVSGCLDGSVRVWRIVEGLDGGVSAQLVWGVGNNHLCASATVLVDVVSLSTANRLLLKQRGAIDGSESEGEDESEDESEDDD